MPTIAERAASEDTGAPDRCVGCHYAAQEPVLPIVPCRVTYCDGSVAAEPIHYCVECRTLIAADPDTIVAAEPIPASAVGEA